MIINEASLGELCGRVANGDEEALREFDRDVLPVVEAIVGRWLSGQGAKTSEHHGPLLENSLTDSAREALAANLLPKVAAAVCDQMVADAAGRQRARRRLTPAKPRQSAGETLSALIERHTVRRLIPWPA